MNLTIICYIVFREKVK